MAAKKEEPPKDPAPTPKEEPVPFEDRLDDAAVEMFELLGFEGRLPEPLVAVYKEFKRRKDKLHPGPLTPEGYVVVLFLAGLVNKKDF